MKKRNKIILLSSILAVSVAATVTTVVLLKDKKPENVSAYLWDYPFEVDDWYFSGKGFQFDFTFNQNEVTQNSEQGIELLATGDQRVTNNQVKIYFKTDGSVTSNKGNIIKNNDGSYTFAVMFNEFVNGETIDSKVITGHEHVCKLSFRWAPFEMTRLRSKLIDSRMNVYPEATIRDEVDDDLHGLMFKSYVPSIAENTKYGMAIVPNEYLGELTEDYCASFNTQGKSYVEAYCNPLPITQSDPLYDRYGGGYYIKCSLTGIKETNYLRDYSAVPFEEVNGVRKYAWNTNEEKDNVYDVCTRTKVNNLSFSESAIQYQNSILNNVKNRESSLSTNNITVKVVNSTDQYLKNDNNVTVIDNKISIKAAKGETENAQIVLSSTSNNIDLYAGVSNLELGNNIIDNNNIETSVELYNNITTNWSSTTEHYNYLPHLYPNGTELCTLGYWPDALLPMDIAVRTQRNKIQTLHGQNQGLFFRFAVPENAVSGTYTGNVVVYAKGEGLITVPVELTVLDFSIANNVSANSIIILNRSETQTLYNINYNDVLSSEPYKAGIKFLAERSVSGGLLPCRISKTEDLPEYVNTVKEFIKNGKTDSYLLDFNQDTVSMDWTYRKNSSSILNTTTVHVEEDVFCMDDSVGQWGEKIGLKKILTALVEASTSDLDLLKGATIYDPHADEPSIPSKYVRNILNYNALRKSIDYVSANCDFTGKENVRQSLQDIFYICTAGPENRFIGTKFSEAYADVVSISNVEGASACGCATLNDITYRQLRDYTPNMMWDWNSGETNGKGQCWEGMQGVYDGDPDAFRAWEYTCIQPVAPYPTYTLNTPTVRIRANAWRRFNLNFDGFLFYMANRSTLYKNDVSTRLTEEEILNGGVYYEDASSDGLLIYPVHDMFGYADRNLYYLSSLRLECTSKANDDLKYLNYAKELINNLASPSSYLTRLTNICNTLSVNNCPAKVTNDASIVNAARENLIQLILELA